MRIGKKLFSCLSLFLLCILCLLADAPKVRAAEFLTADNGTFLYMNSRELEICDEEDGVQFFRADLRPPEPEDTPCVPAGCSCAWHCQRNRSIVARGVKPCLRSIYT